MPAEFIDFSTKAFRGSAQVGVTYPSEAAAASARLRDLGFLESQAREGPTWCQARLPIPVPDLKCNESSVSDLAAGNS
jgi:hypothetical protein